MVKIESVNPPVGNSASVGKGVESAKSTNVLTQEIPSQAQNLISGTDSVKISIPNFQTEKNISILITKLIDLLAADTASTPIQEIRQQGLPLFQSLFYKGEEPLSFLKDFIGKSGLLYEAKIAGGDLKAVDKDLKGLLLKIVEKLGENSEGGKTAANLLNDVESRQLLNLAAKDNGSLCLQIPILLPQGPSSAEIHVMRDGKEKGGYRGKSYRVGFSIELKEIGLLSIEAYVNGNNVSVRTQAEKAEFLEFINFHLGELSDRLAGYGMKVEFSRVKKKPD